MVDVGDYAKVAEIGDGDRGYASFKVGGKTGGSYVGRVSSAEEVYVCTRQRGCGAVWNATARMAGARP